MTKTDELDANRTLWTTVNEHSPDDEAVPAWRSPQITWGLYKAREAEPGVLGDVQGLDVVEPCCATAHFSAWLAHRSGRRSLRDRDG